jgi:deoxyribonuclease V
MFVPAKILVPTDFSEYSDKTLRRAFDIAEQYRAKVFFLLPASQVPAGQKGGAVTNIGSVTRDVLKGHRRPVPLTKQRGSMIACLDVHYFTDTARAAAIVSSDWTDTRPANQYAVLVHGNEMYEPGKFYLRELKPLMAVIGLIREPISIYVIDAYCYLSSDHKPGLGTYLYGVIGQKSAITGVAKNRFRYSQHATEVFRGGSKRPLYVTSVGLSQEEAASRISAMSGKFRIPTLLKMAHQMARENKITEPGIRRGIVLSV